MFLLERFLKVRLHTHQHQVVRPAQNELVGLYRGVLNLVNSVDLLVILLIFVICSIHFNSLRYPLAIILLIPISFIGLFLAFGISDFTFDKGGFAAFIMLSGISVNAGIYLVSEYLHMPRRVNCGGDVTIQAYIRAFNRKSLPVALTILSTVLGLLPFLFDGPSEVFWFAFAIGTISGILFSIVALVFYLPVFTLKRP